MSFAQQIAAASRQAQFVLAELGGAKPGQTNSLYNGKAYTAVYGQPQVENIQMLGGGYRQRTYLPLSVTRAQFTTPPVSKQKWTRTDCTPHISYTIDWVGTHDSYVFTLSLIRTGEGL